MTDAQLELLLMVAKDMRQLWKRMGFDIVSDSTSVRRRRDLYDEVIRNVEQETRNPERK